MNADAEADIRTTPVGEFTRPAESMVLASVYETTSVTPKESPVATQTVEVSTHPVFDANEVSYLHQWEDTSTTIANQHESLSGINRQAQVYHLHFRKIPGI